MSIENVATSEPRLVDKDARVSSAGIQRLSVYSIEEALRRSSGVVAEKSVDEAYMITSIGDIDDFE